MQNVRTAGAGDDQGALGGAFRSTFAYQAISPNISTVCEFPAVGAVDRHDRDAWRGSAKVRVLARLSSARMSAIGRMETRFQSDISARRSSVPLFPEGARAPRHVRAPGEQRLPSALEFQGRGERPDLEVRVQRPLGQLDAAGELAQIWAAIVRRVRSGRRAGDEIQQPEPFGFRRFDDPPLKHISAACAGPISRGSTTTPPGLRRSRARS